MLDEFLSAEFLEKIGVTDEVKTSLILASKFFNVLHNTNIYILQHAKRWGYKAELVATFIWFL